MPVVLLSIDGVYTGGPALQQAKAALGDVGVALDRAATLATNFEAAFARANAGAIQFAGGVGTASTALQRMNALLDSNNALIDRANVLYGSGATSVNAWATAQARAVTSADAATVSIRAQTAAYSDLMAAQRLSATSSVGGTVVQDVANVASTSRLGKATNILASGAAGDIGLLGRAGAAILGPEGMAALGIGYTGFKASQAGAGFQSAEQQTIAQIGGDPYTAAGRANIARGHAAAQNILNYGGSGQDPYNVTAQMRGIEPLLAHGYGQATIQQGITTVSELSAQNQAPDLSNAVNGVNTYLALLGSGAMSTAAQMKQAGDYFSQMEKQTTIPPGRLTPAMTNVMTAAIGTGITPDQLAAGFIKIGTANSNAAQDSTTYSRLIQELLVKNTPGAMKEAASLNLAMGPGALNAYGGSLEAMVQAYANATAGPNQAADLAKLFPTSGVRGGSTAFKELLAGGGTQQALGYEAQMGQSSGAGQAAYLQYSQGIQQQEVQLTNQLNSQFVLLGQTINSQVLPALVDMAGGALSAISFLEKEYPKLPKNIGPVTPASQNTPSPWNMLMNQLHWVGTNAIPAVAHGIGAGVGAGVSATGYAFGHIGNAIGAPMSNGVDPINAALARASASSEPMNTFVRHLGSLKGGTGDQGVLDTGQGNDFARHLGSLKGGTGDQGFGSRLPELTAGLSALGPMVTALGTPFDMLTTAVTTAAAGLRNSLGPPSNVPLNADRSTLQMMIGSGATTPRMYTELASLKNDLANSTYSPAQQQAIYQQASQRVYAAATGPGDQLAIQAAQMNLDAAQQMGLPPAQIKRDQDAYLTALTEFYNDTETGTKRATDLRSVAVQGQMYSSADQGAAIDRTLKDLQNKVAVDTSLGNTGALGKDNAAVLAYQRQNASYFKLDPSDLAIISASNQAALMLANPITNTKPFFDTNQGLAGFQAGPESTSVRIGGAGEDPLVLENRALRQENSRDNAEIITLLRQIASLGVKPNVASSGRVQR